VAHLLREQGFNAYVMAGGMRAWRMGGHPVEQIPEHDLIKLPTFS
jgi:rhodanese-related sulfurtransferase